MPEKAGLKAKIMPWSPLGKAGFIQTRQRRHARKHLHKVEMSLTPGGKHRTCANHCQRAPSTWFVPLGDYRRLAVHAAQLAVAPLFELEGDLRVDRHYRREG